MKRESCVADGILFKIGIHMHYIKKKKRKKKKMPLFHFTFSYFVRGNAAAQVIL